MQTKDHSIITNGKKITRVVITVRRLLKRGAYKYIFDRGALIRDGGLLRRALIRENTVIIGIIY